MDSFISKLRAACAICLKWWEQQKHLRPLWVTRYCSQGMALEELSNGAHGIPAEPKSTKNLDSIKVENGVITRDWHGSCRWCDLHTKTK